MILEESHSSIESKVGSAEILAAQEKSTPKKLKLDFKVVNTPDEKIASEVQEEGEASLSLTPKSSRSFKFKQLKVDSVFAAQKSYQDGG